MALNYVYILLFWEQLVIYFNNDNIAQECSAKIYIQTPCVTVLILSECRNSLFETIRTALSRTAPHIINLDLLLSARWLWWASQRITLLVTGAAYIIRLIRDFVTLTLELATVCMVVRWIVPCPGSRCLTSLARSGECQR